MPARLMVFSIVAASAAVFHLARACPAGDVEPLVQAHAHNDYYHPRPLFDALDCGFTSVEADVFLVDGELLVAHARREIKPGHTLQKLYLDPLRARVKANGGAVYRGGGPFHLLIDIKSDGEPTYRALAKVLAEYDDIMTSVRDGEVEQKAVDVTISGNRPIALMKNESVRHAGVDGRWGDLDSDLPPHLMPLVSDNWNLQFRWRGTGPLPEAERKKLADAVKKARASGRKLRLWATPDTEAAWRELHAAGVDWINTDDLAGLEKFLRAQASGKKGASE